MTSSTKLFETNATYSFETLAPAILGAKHKNAMCTGELSYGTAVRAGYNVGALYRDIYVHLPVGTPDTPKLLRYYEFKTEAGGDLIVCEQWVDSSTIEKLEHLDVTMEFNRISPSDLKQITDLLRASGYPPSSVAQSGD